MFMVWLWSRADDKGLVRFVTSEARQWITLEMSRYDVGEKPDKHLLIIEDIYNQLLEKKIHYVPDAYHPSEWKQRLRSPDTFFYTIEGTLFDLSMLFIL